ncbi:MAG: glycine cleavage system protein GcvH [Gammaproteobacteria bacterium]|nr:glycine cleavage system protein GcvH [Gammaproteobacteria bacterium]
MSTRYTTDHEWARIEGETVVIGISNYAQHQLGDVVYVELPDIGQMLEQGEEAAVIESVKAAGEVKSPVSGEVTEVNNALDDAPEQVNEDPEGDGWIFKLKPSDSGEFESLMDDDAYQALIESLS